MDDNKKPAQLTKQDEKGGYVVSWDEKKQIIDVQAYGETNEQIAKDMTQAMFSVATEHHGHGNVLIDVSQNHKVTTDARRVFEEFHKKPEINKVAFVGASLYIRVIVNFVNTATKQTSKTKFCSTKEEAIQWFNQK